MQKLCAVLVCLLIAACSSDPQPGPAGTDSGVDAPGPDVAPDSEPQPEPEPDVPEPDVAEPEPEPDAEPDASSDSGVGADGSDTDVVGRSPDVELPLDDGSADADLGGVETDGAVGPQPDAEPDAEPEPDSGPEPDAGPGPGLDLLSEPLGTSAPGFAPVQHGLQPSAWWGSLTGPYPTNAWWQNFVLGSGENTVNALPYQVKTRPDGLVFCLAEKVVTETFIITIFIDNLAFGATEGLTGREVVGYDPLSVTVAWSGGAGTMTAPIVRGMPYVSMSYAGLTPRLSTIHAILSVNGADVAGPHTGTRFELELNNGQTWVVYASSPITLQAGGGGLVANAPFTGWLRAAILAPGAAGTLDAHAGRVPTGGQVSAASEGDAATLTFDWSAEGEGELLMMALPHHFDVLEGVETQSAPVYDTIKGSMGAVAGETWSMVEPLTTIGWGAPSGIDPARKAAVEEALAGDVGKVPVAPDPYFFGKQIAAMGRLALIADELGDPLAGSYREGMKPHLEPWLLGTNGDPLVWDQTWGGIVATSGLADPGANFGQGYYNDHHFHYGYHIYAAAALAKEDPAWLAAHGDRVWDLVRTIANPSPADPHHAVLRNKDWFVGHSWAAGLFEFADSRNQESTSEAVNAWYGVYLWGLATGDQRVADLGRLLLATELRSVHRYWQITSDSDIYPSPFKENKVVGILWSTKVDYTTFFGANTEFIHGIQMLPFTPITEELLRPEWISEEYPLLSTAIGTAGQGWLGFIYMAHGVIDKDAAWSEAQTLNAYDDGNTKTNTLYWLATRP